MKNKNIRLANMERILNERRLVRIREMADELEVSEMTVRRDAQILEAQGKAKNVNGILVSPASSTFSLVSRPYELSQEAMTQNAAKAAVGKFAASRIQAGDSILFDIGTSVEQVAKNAPQDIKFDGFCVSLNILMHLLERPKATVALAGGYYHSETKTFLCEEGLRFLRHIRANKVFLSAAGIHADLGISCVNPYEVAIKRTMLQSARHHILVADSSKFGVLHSAHFCDLGDIDEIITDNELSEDWVRLIESKNIVLHRVPVK